MHVATDLSRLRGNLFCSPVGTIASHSFHACIKHLLVKRVDRCSSLFTFGHIDRIDTMRHPDYPIWSLICLVLVLLPSPWHWRARNISTIGLIFWLAVYNCIVFINTLVWADNYADVAPVWSEISQYKTYTTC